MELGAFNSQRLILMKLSVKCRMHKLLQINKAAQMYITQPVTKLVLMETVLTGMNTALSYN